MSRKWTSCDDSQNEEWQKSLLMEKKLREKLLEVVTMMMTFDELFILMNNYIYEQGFEI